MRKIKFAGFFIVILIASGYLIQAQSLPIPEGRRLRDIVEDNYPDGKLLVVATTVS